MEHKLGACLGGALQHACHVSGGNWPLAVAASLASSQPHVAAQASSQTLAFIHQSKVVLEGGLWLDGPRPAQSAPGVGWTPLLEGCLLRPLQLSWRQVPVEAGVKA